MILEIIWILMLEKLHRRGFIVQLCAILQGLRTAPIVGVWKEYHSLPEMLYVALHMKRGLKVILHKRV